MPNPFVVQGPMLREIAQGLLEMKKMARSIDNSAVAFLPLVDDSQAKQRLEIISEMSESISKNVNALYSEIAREAAQV